MPKVFADCVKDTTNTSGTGPFTLNAVSEAGFRLFGDVSAFLVSGNQFPVKIFDGPEWNTALAHLSDATTLVIDEIYDGSSGLGVAVAFAAGPKTVHIELPAAVIAGFVGKASSFTENYLPKVDADGNLVDSGIRESDTEVRVNAPGKDVYIGDEDGDGLAWARFSKADQTITLKAANGIIINGVKKYVALLSQGGTNDPVATVQENSLGGDVMWTRTGPGRFLGTLAGAFPAGRTAILSTWIPSDNDHAFVVWNDEDSILVVDGDDGGLSGLPHHVVNIAVYPA